MFMVKFNQINVNKLIDEINFFKNCGIFERGNEKYNKKTRRCIGDSKFRSEFGTVLKDYDLKNNKELDNIQTKILNNSGKKHYRGARETIQVAEQC